MNGIVTNRAARRALDADNRHEPLALRIVHRNDWPAYRPERIMEVWRSRDFLLQVFKESDGIERLSICRTQLDGQRWQDGISWDDLQRLKRECGRGDRDAVEIYPADADVVNVANMRHLWVLPIALPFKWRGEARADADTPRGKS